MPSLKAAFVVVVSAVLSLTLTAMMCAHMLRPEPPPAARGLFYRLSERGFDALRFRGPGTDLTVGLAEGGTWIGGGHDTAWGQEHMANMPTEEVFTSPDPARTEGTVRSTLPLV